MVSDAIKHALTLTLVSLGYISVFVNAEDSTERIVLLDFIHRLLTQEQTKLRN
jgi:hypothetical protein